MSNIMIFDKMRMMLTLLLVALLKAGNKIGLDFEVEKKSEFTKKVFEYELGIYTEYSRCII